MENKVKKEVLLELELLVKFYIIIIILVMNIINYLLDKDP